MKKVLAVIVSIFWIALIVGVPALALSGNLSQFIPAQVREQLALLGAPELLDRLNLGQNEPGVEISEPVVVVETVTPAAEEAPAPTPTDEPTPVPTPTPEPTATPVVEPTATPASEAAELPDATLASFPVGVRGQAELRTGPGLDFDAVGLVDAGATILVVVQDETGQWFQMENGTWIPAEALTTRPPVPIVLPTPVPTEETVPAATPEAAENPTPAAPATPVVVRVNADANLRSGPGATFERVGGANFGSEVTVTGKFATDNWYLLDSGAWIFGELLETAPDVPLVNADGTPVGSAPAAESPAAETPTTGATTPTANVLANLRAAPNTTAAIVGSAQPGEALSLLGKNAAGDWLQLASGAWIFAALVNDVPADLPVVQEAGAGTQGNTATEAGQTDAATPEEQTTGEEQTAGESTADAGAGTDAAAASAAVDANLRGGPGTNFDLVGSVTAGANLTLVGRNEAGDWFKLDSGAWIFGELVNNAPADLPVATE